MKFNAKASLLAVFAAATLLTGCGERPTPEQEQQKQAATLKQLEQKDRAFFRQVGFEVVARTGTGICDSNGEMGTPDYYGKATDLTYILKKTSNENVTYTACMVHTRDGLSTMRGLKSVERYVTPGAPQQ